jgi:DNA-binding Lrp family transcriptional regulator
MDKKDIALLNELQMNSNQSMKTLAGKTGLPISTIHNRIKKYQQEGIIKEYRAILDDKKIGGRITAFVMMSVDKSSKTALNEKQIAEKLSNFSFVQECHITQGTYDVILKVKLKDIDEMANHVLPELRKLEGISNIDMFISIQKTKETTLTQL